MNDRLAGIVLGTAVGDALGLPAEGLSPARRRRLMPGPWRHRLLLGRGMISDDTEHALFVAQSLLQYPENADAFQRRLAWHLRWWFAGLPAGIGLATARACLKRWLGFSAQRSGVFSAGNGPAMRSTLIGGYFHDQPAMLHRFVLASTQLTHTDPKAAIGAEAVARVAAWAVEHDPAEQPDVEPIMAGLAGLPLLRWRFGLLFRTRHCRSLACASGYFGRADRVGVSAASVAWRKENRKNRFTAVDIAYDKHYT